MPGEPAADDGREVDGKAPVPPATHGPPLRRGLHSPEVPSGSYAGTHNDNLSGDAPAIGFPTASPVLPGVISQVTVTLTPLFQGQLLGDPAQGSSYGLRCAGRGGGGTGVGGCGAGSPHSGRRLRAARGSRSATSRGESGPKKSGEEHRLCGHHTWAAWKRPAPATGCGGNVVQR